MKTAVVLLALLLSSTAAAAPSVAQYLQDISVTIRSNTAEGSGVIKTRQLDGQQVNFVWTAAHVVAGLRHVKTVVTADGTERRQAQFEDCLIVKELVEDSRRVGELRMDAQVVRFSAKEDLALLQIRKKGFVPASARFYLDPNTPAIGTPLYHVGSMLGQAGSNSMTEGIVSQIGRVLENLPFDQTTVAAFPGCSGGGVYLHDGRYVGMVVRGAGETFNLIVPIRRMAAWATKAKVGWALDDQVPMPGASELEALPVEDTGVQFAPKPATVKALPYLIRRADEWPGRPQRAVIETYKTTGRLYEYRPYDRHALPQPQCH